MLTSPVGGLAASIGGITGTLGSGNTAVASCDDAIGESYATSGGNVTTVTVTGIADPACEGGALSVRLTNGSGDSIGAAGPITVPTDGDTADNSITLGVSPQPFAGNVAGIRVSIEGP